MKAAQYQPLQRFLMRGLPLITAVIFLGCAQSAFGQWAASPSPSPNNNIYYNAGNVGIGTNNPGDVLHVSNAVRISPFTPNTSGSYINGGAALRLINGNIYAESEISSIQFGGMYNPSGTQTDAFYNYIDWSNGWLRVRNNQQTKIQIGGGDEWGRQDIYFNPGGGKVGVGTTTPQAKMDIAQSGSFNSTSPGLGRYGLHLTPTDTTQNNAVGITFGADTSSGQTAQAGIYSQYSSAYGTKLFFATTNAYSVGAVNRMMIDAAGNVGIGTTSPGDKLTIGGASGDITIGQTAFGSGDYNAIYLNGRTGTGNYNVISKSGDQNLYINRPSGKDIYFRENNSIEQLFLKNGGFVGIGTTNPQNKLHVAGSITIDGNINAKYQDVAEWVPSSEQLPAGTVVVLDSTKSNQVISSSVSYDTRVAGVISEQPGLALGEKADNKVLVATTGRVKVKVDASKGPIHIGDLLVTSDVPGVAMKSEAVNLGGVQFHRPGTLIGKALEPLEKGKGEILVLLSLQ